MYYIVESRYKIEIYYILNDIVNIKSNTYNINI